MYKLVKLFIILFFIGFVSDASAHEDKTRLGKPGNVQKQDTQVNYREDCQAARAQIDMSINNVRARLLTGGDVWWDLNEGKYIVPNVGPDQEDVSSIFAGSVWIGGLDPSGNIKVAGGQYRTGGVDFYPGPLDPSTGLTDLEVCNDWDRFFKVSGEDIETAIQLYDQAVLTGIPVDPDLIPDGVKYWPGAGNADFLSFYNFELPDTGQGLGSFWDQDEDGIYDPSQGDFPIIEIRGCAPDGRTKATTLVPDEMIYWIYNDSGGPHGLTNGEQIQMEIQVQAFAYATNDELNDMTFQRYKLINRASEDIRNTYFAMWVDADLGCHTDDYIGCVAERSLMYTYNEDVLDGTTGCNCDGGTATYCDKVPIIGMDYFRGPLGPKLFGPNGELIDPPLDAIGFDTLVELGMSSFTYMNNGGIGSPDPATTDPDNAEEFYNCLRGLWRDGTPVTFGGSGFNPGSTDTVKYVFPDAPNVANGWSMCESDLPFGDRRTLQTSGPFLLKPGAVNELIIGAVWVPEISYPCPDITRLLRADDLAQAVFDACFEIPRGPDAPDVCLIELDQEIILVLSNDTIASNNKFEKYLEEDILAPEGVEDVNYVFEGYKVYQLANENVTTQELDDPTKARIIRQVDLKNGITDVYNWTASVNPTSGAGDLVYDYERMVSASDAGIKNTFQITDNQFAEGDRTLINHKKYFFTVLAYAYNEYEPFDPATQLGQKTPYREGRKNIMTYTGVPRPIVYENIQSSYGDGPIVRRLDGVGSGGNFMELNDDMYEPIFNGESIEKLVYREGAGPINISIFNPLDVVDGTYELEILGDFVPGGTCALADSAQWKLTHIVSGQSFSSDKSIDEVSEQIIGEFGFSVNVAQVDEPGITTDENNGYLGAKFEYDDPNGVFWYGAVTDGLGQTDVGDLEDGALGFLAEAFNFLKTNDGEPDFASDMNQSFSDGLFYPFWLCDYTADQGGQFPFYITPAWKQSGRHQVVRSSNGIDRLNNVDIVFTSDKDKWSRCIVVETATEDYTLTESTIGDAEMMELRASPSVNRNGDADGTGDGMSWFPGYAVDVETGKRLNIFFGENSVFDIDNMALTGDQPLGGDMMFNPSSQPFTDAFDAQNPLPVQFVVGGGHNIYVTRQEYDGCESIREAISGNILGQADALRSVTWTSMAMLPPGTSMNSYADGAVPNDLTVKLRVNNPYSVERTFDLDDASGCTTVGGNPKYEFEIRGKAATELAEDQYTGALENINVVPNPYYGYSSYEPSQFASVIKITNLPARAIVTIYSLDGKFVRQFNRDERATLKDGNNPPVTQSQVLPDINWDMKNYANIPVASGVYLIHVRAEDLGEERTIKWFGVNREFDPSGL